MSYDDEQSTHHGQPGALDWLRPVLPMGSLAALEYLNTCRSVVAEPGRHVTPR